MRNKTNNKSNGIVLALLSLCLLIPILLIIAFLTFWQETAFEFEERNFDFTVITELIDDDSFEKFRVNNMTMRSSIIPGDSGYTIIVTGYTKENPSVMIKNIKLSSIEGNVLFEEKNLYVPIILSDEASGVRCGDYVCSKQIPKDAFVDGMSYLLEIEVQSQDYNGNLEEIKKMTYIIDAKEYIYRLSDIFLSV